LVGGCRAGTASILSFPDPFRVGTWAVSRWLKRGRHPPLPLRSVPPVSARAPPVASLFRPILCPAWVSEWLKGCAGDEGTHLPFLVSSPSRAMPSVGRRQWLKGRHGPHSVLPSIILRPSEWLGGRLTPGIGLHSAPRFTVLRGARQWLGGRLAPYSGLRSTPRGAVPCAKGWRLRTGTSPSFLPSCSVLVLGGRRQSGGRAGTRPSSPFTSVSPP
jgi:hypothetical protein